MQALKSRKSRVLLVAAVSSSAWVGTGATAHAATSCGPLIGCMGTVGQTLILPMTEPVATAAAIDTGAPKAAADRVVVENTPRHAVQRVKAAVDTPPLKQSVLSQQLQLLSDNATGRQTLDGECQDGQTLVPVWSLPAHRIEFSAHPLWALCDQYEVAPDVARAIAAPSVDTSDRARAVEVSGTAQRSSGTNETATAPAAETSSPARAATSGSSPAKAGGVDVDAADAAVAPEQYEVSGPSTVRGGDLPATGADTALLTMLGLTLVGSGAAVRRLARD